MTVCPMELAELVQVQKTLALSLVASFDADEKRFLLSMKAGDPEWDILGFEHLEAMPALQWKLLNIRKMDAKKRSEQFEALKTVLNET